MIGDEATGTAAVVDPQRDTDQYIAFAAEHSLKIKFVFLTHLHADFIAGHLELRGRVGATIYLGAAAKAGYAFTPLHDEEILEFGRVRLKVLETPSHTPESISILVYDLNASETQPYDVLALQKVGAQILDTRDSGEFAAAHLAGSINIGLGGKYATWAGTILDREHPIVIVAAPGRENESATRLGRIGFDHVVGYLKDGLLSLQSRPELTVKTERISASFAAELLSSPEPPLAIDVRTPSEHEQKQIAGSLGISLNHHYGRSRKNSERPLSPAFLRGWLPVVYRRQSVAARRI